MDIGLTFALMHLSIIAIFTVLLVGLSSYEKRREKKEEEGMRMKAGGKEYKSAA